MCGLMNIDIPQLSSSGIEFGNHSFQFVDSIQSSSRFSNFFFFIDATELESAIRRIQQEKEHVPS